MRLAKLGIPFLSLCAAAVVLAGCGSGVVSEIKDPVAPGGGSTQTPFGNISGVVYGGQQPIVGASIYAYSASTASYGGASVVQAGPEITGTGGTFSFPASSTCTAGTQVYLYSVGGNPGQVSGTNNQAATLMAALGLCPTDGLLEDTVGPSTRIVMNEASTIALAYAAAGFATDPLHIGAPSATDTLAKTGLANAFANAAQLYSLPYGSTTARSVTPYGNGTVPMTTLNTLANILAACVNTTSAAAAACTSAATGTPSKGLFYYATSSGTAGSGTEPTDTATAAIYIAQHPGSNVAALFNLTGSTIIPFYPALTTAPNDFSITIAFTGGGLVATGDFIAPHGLSVDASGNVWTTNTSSSVLSAFSPLGVPFNSTGFSNSLSGPSNATVDTAGNIWVANTGNGKISKFSPSGMATATYAPGLTAPYDVQFDAAGNLWVPDVSTNGIYKISNAGVILKSNTANAAEPVSVAVQSGTTGFVFATDFETDYDDLSVFTHNDVSDSYFESSETTVGLAIDSSNYCWGAETESYALYVNDTAGYEYTIDTGMYYAVLPGAIVVDGASNAWITDYDNATVLELNNAGTLLSPTYGWLPPGNTISSRKAATRTVKPNSIAIDGSGDVWYNNQSAAKLYEIIGIATPVATPVAYGTAHGLLGSKP